jgi:DNA replicative helicase MCM subunit Mcm2 (Cdc46/Mcm family)
MKKYIHIAKCMKPTLTEEASEAIAEEYSRLRSQDTMDTDIARVCINLLDEIHVNCSGKGMNDLNG